MTQSDHVLPSETSFPDTINTSQNEIKEIDTPSEIDEPINVFGCTFTGDYVCISCKRESEFVKSKDKLEPYMCDTFKLYKDYPFYYGSTHLNVAELYF